ncbi:TPA: YkyA family protein [Streptococcus suis]
MKKLKPILLIIVSCVLLAACDNSLERANNAVSLMQDKVGQIVNGLYQIQDLENLLQEHFESDLTNAGDDLTYFTKDEALVIQNVDQRKLALETIEKALEELEGLKPELARIKEGSTLPTSDFGQINSMIDNLAIDLKTYLADYQTNLELERQTYQSIGNPETNYETFFQVFDNINILSETNLYNLDLVLKNFEPLNRLLVDTKIKIVTIIDNQ